MFLDLARGLFGFDPRGITCRCEPNSDSESDFVHKVSEVVDDIERIDASRLSHVAHYVPDWVNSPTDRDNKSNGLECALTGDIRAVRVNFTGFANEDFIDDVKPSDHSNDESNCDIYESCFAHVAANQHYDRGDQQFPEERGGDYGNRCQDEEELDDLQRDGQQPVYVTIYSRTLAQNDPDLSHIEVVDSSNEGY